MARREPGMQVVADQAAIAAAVRRMADDIARAYEDASRLVAVVVLEGARRFAEDLLAALPARPTVAFVRASSYRDGTQSSGLVALDGHDAHDLSGREVLIIDDILDTGLTLAALKAALADQGARDVKVCVLLAKERSRAAAVGADFVGLTVPDRFLVGYGLDHAGRFRDLPFIAALPGLPMHPDGGEAHKRRSR